MSNTTKSSDIELETLPSEVSQASLTQLKTELVDSSSSSSCSLYYFILRCLHYGKEYIFMFIAFVAFIELPLDVTALLNEEGQVGTITRAQETTGFIYGYYPADWWGEEPTTPTPVRSSEAYYGDTVCRSGACVELGFLADEPYLEPQFTDILLLNHTNTHCSQGLTLTYECIDLNGLEVFSVPMICVYIDIFISLIGCFIIFQDFMTNTHPFGMKPLLMIDMLISLPLFRSLSRSLSRSLVVTVFLYIKRLEALSGKIELLILVVFIYVQVQCAIINK